MNIHQELMFPKKVPPDIVFGERLIISYVFWTFQLLDLLQNLYSFFI